MPKAKKKKPLTFVHIASCHLQEFERIPHQRYCFAGAQNRQEHQQYEAGCRPRCLSHCEEWGRPTLKRAVPMISSVLQSHLRVMLDKGNFNKQ